MTLKISPKNIYQILIVPVTLWLMSSFALAASWPNPLIIDSDGQIGDVIAEVPITDDLLNRYKFFTGAAYLTVDGCKSISTAQDAQGVYEVSGSNGAIGIRFVGSMTVSSRNNTRTVDKGIGDSLESIGSFATKPWALTQANSPNDTWTDIDIYVTGKVQLFRLKDGPINVSTVVLPTIKLSFNSQLLSGFVQEDSENILTTNAITVGNTRSCQIFASGTSIDFGQFKDNVLAGELSRNKVTQLSIRCTGVASSDTVVTMSIESPTEGVGGDVSAIGMKVLGQTNENLVVKAKLDETATPSCQSATEWLDLSKIHKIGILNKSLTEINEVGTIYWSLCKKTNALLPIGTYEAVAYLNITFN